MSVLAGGCGKLLDQRHLGLAGSPLHGMGIAPDGKTLWVNSKINSSVYAYSQPDLKLLGGVRVGLHADWLTFTPDKSAYIASETAFQKSFSCRLERRHVR